MNNNNINNMFKLNKKGFTLIELLVVIAIIGVLGSIVFAPFNEARKKGRDGKRVAELKTLQSTLTLFSDDNDGCFPDSAAVGVVANGIQANANKYVSANFAAKVFSLNQGALLLTPVNAWTAPAPYGFRSVGLPAACTRTAAAGVNFYPYYQLAVELETQSSALSGDSDANYTTATYAGALNYNGLDMSGIGAGGTAPETCVSSVVGNWDCVFDIDN